MPSLFLYLIFVLIAAVGGGHDLQVDIDNPLDRAISLVEQYRNTGGDQSSNGDDLDEYCSIHDAAAVTGLCSRLSSTGFPRTDRLYRAYSARAPPVFLS